jgi:hypothetical protein
MTVNNLQIAILTTSLVLQCTMHLCIVCPMCFNVPLCRSHVCLDVHMCAVTLAAKCKQPQALLQTEELLGPCTRSSICINSTLHIACKEMLVYVNKC